MADAVDRFQRSFKESVMIDDMQQKGLVTDRAFIPRILRYAGMYCNIGVIPLSSEEL